MNQGANRSTNQGTNKIINQSTKQLYELLVENVENTLAHRIGWVE